MRVIIGYGNELRGEDSFGIEVIKKLKRYKKEDTKLLISFQLTPELCPSLLKAKEIIFVDAAYDSLNHYKLACSIKKDENQTLSHQISPHMIITILNKLYNHHPDYLIYSMLTDSFNQIWNKKKFYRCVNKVFSELK